MQNDIVLKTLKEIRAISDPYRQRLMKTLSRLERPATAKEVADALGEPPSKVHYHMGVLEKFGIVEVDHTKVIHGITARYLKMTDRSIKIESENEFDDEMMEFIATHFNNARDEYIENTKNLTSDEKDTAGALMNKIIYLTQKEAQDLIDYISHLKERAKEEDETRYQLFTALIKSSSTIFPKK